MANPVKSKAISQALPSTLGSADGFELLLSLRMADIIVCELGVNPVGFSKSMMMIKANGNSG